MPTSVAGLDFRTAGGSAVSDIAYAFGGAAALGRQLLIAFGGPTTKSVALYWQDASTPSRYNRVSVETVPNSGTFPDISRLAWPLSADKFPAIGFTSSADPEYWQGWSQHNGALVGLITYSGSTITATGNYTGTGGFAIPRLQFRSTSVAVNDFGGPYVMPPLALDTGGSGGVVSMQCTALFNDSFPGSGRLRFWEIGPGGALGYVRVTDYGSVGGAGDAWPAYRPLASGLTGNFSADAATNTRLNSRVHAVYGPVADPMDASRTYYLVFRTTDASTTLPPSPAQAVQLAVSTDGATYTILTAAGEYAGTGLSPQGVGFYRDPTGDSTIVIAIFNATGSQLRGVFSLDGRLHQLGTLSGSTPSQSAYFSFG